MRGFLRMLVYTTGIVVLLYLFLYVLLPAGGGDPNGNSGENEVPESTINSPETTFVKFDPTAELNDDFDLVLNSLWQSASEEYAKFAPLLLCNENKTVVLVQLYAPEDITAAVTEEYDGESANWQSLGTALAEDSGEGQQIFAEKNYEVTVFYTLLQNEPAYTKLLQAQDGKVIYDIISER